VTAIWPRADVQTCVVHLVRNTLRYSARQHLQKITTDLRKVYTAPTLDAATERFSEFDEIWGEKYPAVINLCATPGRSSSRPSSFRVRCAR
jgi:putative transposase